MKLETKLLKNKTMNKDTYKIRRQVIELIYQAKRLVPELPRIEVRIAENSKRTLGVGRMGQRIIWITERSAADKSTVFHEILHAVYSTEHVEGCPLMDAVEQPKVSDHIYDELFQAYARA